MRALQSMLFTAALVACGQHRVRQPAITTSAVTDSVRAPAATILIDTDRIERGDTLRPPTKPLAPEPQQVRPPAERLPKMPERRWDVPMTNLD